MSEEKRKSARTQGRFSGDREFHSTRREKERPKSQKNISSESSSSNVDKRKGEASGTRKTPEGINVQYQENSNYQFKELEKRKPGELKFHGVKEISTTENGISKLIYEPDFMGEDAAQEYMTILESSTTWYDKNIVIHGEEHPQPRLVSWYGPFPYTYSGATLEAAEMPSVVLRIKEKVESALRKHNVEVNLNSVLLNLYRSEKDSVAWHSDDEVTMGICPTIASVSLGEIRKFEMRPKHHVKSYDPDTVLFVNLTPGSLIVMDGCMQKDWMHRVPKEYHNKGRRINLTFRTVYPIDGLPPQVPFSVKASPESRSAIQSKEIPTDHIFDNENFPPLVVAPATKHKISNRDNTAWEVVPPNTSEDVEHVTLGTYSFDNDKYQNNLNQAFNSSQTEIAPPSYEELNNFNINESHQLPDKQVGNGYSIDPPVAPQTGPPSCTDFMSQAVLPGDGTQMTCYPSHCLPEQTFTRMSRAEVRSQLNANAPDFIPQNISQNPGYFAGSSFGGYTLREMVKEFPNLKSEGMDDFEGAIFEKLQKIRNNDFFSKRDWHELDVLRRLSDGTQSEKNQMIILERVCSMVQNAEFKKEREARSPQRYQNQRTYGDYRGSSRYRNVFKSNSYNRQ